MTGRLAPYDATKQASTALSTACPGTVGGPVRIESTAVNMPRTFGEAILTTVTPAGPGVDLAAVARLLAGLPGAAAWGSEGRKAYVYRSREN